MVACILSADLGAYALGIATGKGFKVTLGVFSASDIPAIPMSRMS